MQWKRLHAWRCPFNMYYDIFILGCLVEKPQHGYHIKKKLEETFDVCTTINNNTLYSILKKYERVGVIVKTVELMSEGPSRNVYHITSKGKKYFVEILWDVTEVIIKNRDEFMMRIFYFDFMNPFSRKKVLDLRERFLKSAMKKMNDISEVNDSMFAPKNKDLITYYNKILEEEMYLINQMRNRVDCLCRMNEDGDLQI